MSMLAEPRRRKNYVLTPRGKPLYDDDSRFGSKMLQKMGWSKGKGLGAKESGDTDFVRVKFRGESSGLGFNLRDDKWTQHQNGFNGLLQTLNAQNGGSSGNVNGEQQAEEPDDIDNFQTTGFGFKSEQKKKEIVEITLSGESLEEKSKKSKARVHYKKFTRGKDLSQYSAKDLANIFGKKTFETNDEAPSAVETEQMVEKPQDEESREGKTMSVSDYFKEKMEKRKRSRNDLNSDLIPAYEAPEGDTTSGASLTDYFKRKMSERKSRRKEQNVEISDQTEDKDLNESYFPVEDDKQTHRKTRRKENKETTLHENEDTNDGKSIPKKRKKDKKSKTAEVSNEELHEPTSTAEDKIPMDAKNDACELTPISDSKRCKSLLNETQETPPNNATTRVQNEIKTEDVDTTTKSTESLPSKPPKKPQQDTKSDVSVRLIRRKVNAAKDPFDLKSTLDDLRDLNVYTLSSYAAEKFRRVDLDSFLGSNLKDINGYSFDKDIKLDITRSGKDESRIVAFWEGSSSKYIGSGKKEAYKADSNTNVAQPTKTKTKTKHKSRKFRVQKRRSAFKLGI